MNQTSTEKIQTVLNTLKRVVIKIGTRVIDDEKTRFNLPIMTAIVRDIALLKEKGVEFCWFPPEQWAWDYGN